MLGTMTLLALPATAAVGKTPPGPRTAAEKALFQYAACMRAKGVKIPDPVRGKNGTYAFPKIPASVLNAKGVRQKAQACEAKLPPGAIPRNRPSAAQQAASKKFTDCMKKNGVKVSQPQGNGPPPNAQAPSGQRPDQGQRPPGGVFNSKDPKVKAALAKCQKLMPSRNG